MLTALPGGIDALIDLFSPERGVRRMLAREVMGRARRLDRIPRETYAAAKSKRLVGPWSPGNTNVNDIIGASSSTLRARVRQLVRDFPYFARAVNIIVDYVVGAGIVYQVRVQDESGKLDRKTNQCIEDVFTPITFQAGVGAAMDKETNKKIEELENAIIQYLRPREEVTPSPRTCGPGTTFRRSCAWCCACCRIKTPRLCVAHYPGS